MNPMSSVLKDDSGRLANEDAFRKQTLGQLPIPMEKEEHLLDPWFYKCDGKIIKYDMRELGRWKVYYSSRFGRDCPSSTYVNFRQSCKF